MASIIGVNSKEYISSLNFLDKRDYLNQVLDITNETSTLVDVLELTGRVKVTDAPEYTHAENQYLFKAGVIESVAASPNGDAAAEDIQFVITTGTDNALPVVGEIAMFQNKKAAIVTAVTVATRTVVAKPLDQGTAINTGGTAIVAAQSVIFFSAAAAEGSDDPSTRQSEWVQSKNNIQIFKEAGEITDLQKVSAVEVVYNGKPYIMYKVQHDAFTRHKMKMSNAMLFGQKAETSNVAGVTLSGGEKIYTTQGLRSYIFSGDGTQKTTGGVTEAYTKSSGIVAADIRNLVRALDKNQAPDEYMGWIGGDLYAAIDDYLLSLDGVRNGIDFSAFGQADPKKRAVDLGFDSFRIYGRTFHLNKLKLADHKGLFGATGFDFASEGYFAPTDKIKIDAGGGTSDRMLLRVMAGDGTNFYPHMETVTGKLAPNPTNTKSVLHVSYQTIAGLQVVGTDHFACLYGV
jgi:hypothetical protein